MTPASTSLAEIKTLRSITFDYTKLTTRELTCSRRCPTSKS